MSSRVVPTGDSLKGRIHSGALFSRGNRNRANHKVSSLEPHKQAWGEAQPPSNYRRPLALFKQISSCDSLLGAEREGGGKHIAEGLEI